METKVTMPIQVLGHQPSYSNEHAAGLDLRLTTESPVRLEQGDHFIAHTGLSVEIPEGYFGLICVRSGLGMKGLMLANAIGVIDEDYRGEIRIPFFYHGEEEMVLEDGERVAQMILVPYVQAQCREVEELTDSQRGNRGFGSSGRF